MTARWRRCRLIIAAVGGAAALFCGPAAATKLAGVPAAPHPALARLTAHFQAASHSAECDPTASLHPVGPPVVTPGSYMARIKKRGYLIAGVDQSTYHFGYLNPLNGQLEGFDIDMVRAVAAAIFGNPKNRIRFVSISDDQRKWAIRSGEVDIVAHTMTITCARWRKVAFSTVYLVAAQRVLVPLTSSATSLSDLLGQKVCATTGSTSLGFIRAYFINLGTVEPVASVRYWTDCLVLLQEGKVAAISTDDTILAGLAAQDPEAKIIGPPLNSQPYGLAISLKHPDFVRFVNAVLARMRADGQWAASYRHWIGTSVPAPPPAQYRD